METILWYSGIFFSTAGWLLLIIAAFRSGFVWGIFSLFFPAVFIIFIPLHWDESKRGVLFWGLGFLLFVAYGFVGTQ